MKSNIFLFVLTVFLSVTMAQKLCAHDPQQHHDEEKKEASVDSITQTGDSLHHDEAHDTEMHQGALLSLEEFPNYHPLLVHFPIVILLIAFFMQLFGFFIKSDIYHKSILALAVLGYASAYFAAAWRHPHVDPELVNDTIQSIFDEHQFYAKWAVYLGGAGAVAKAVELYFKRKLVWVILTTLLMASAATSVSISGHHGAELVHKHGVGTQGRFLEVHEDGHEHEH
ncbi:MAG: hypothetical protein CMN32_06315 [Saprospirales bacterium]|nr:hypothetical protein [Saprospirales bacterium]